MKLLISIIIPVYNSEKYVKDTLESCLKQTYTNLEIIIVNDGSTDKSEKIINGFNDTRIKYFKITNSGPCYARNFGIKKATGDLFQFLDADDILEKDKIKAQVKIYESHGEDFIYGGIMGAIIKGQKYLEPGFEFYYRNLTPQEYFRNMFHNFGKYYTTGIWLVPRKLVEGTHGWDEKVKINNDGEYFTRIILNSKGIIFCPESIFYYRRDVPKSVSKRFDSREIYESWLYSYSCYVENFNKNLGKKVAADLGRKALSVFYCNSYPNYPELSRECRMQIRALGWKNPVAHGGKSFRIIAGVIGVDMALRLRALKDSI